MTHRLVPLAADRTTIECTWAFAPEALASAGLRPGVRGRLLGHHQPAGLGGVRVRAARAVAPSTPAGPAGARRGRGLPVRHHGRPRLPGRAGLGRGPAAAVAGCGLTGAEETWRQAAFTRGPDWCIPQAKGSARGAATTSPSPPWPASPPRWATCPARRCSSSTSPPSAGSPRSTRAWSGCRSATPTGASRSSASRATSSAARSRARPRRSPTFCSTTYGVTFPMFEKIEVNGDGRHPLYQELTAVADAEGEAGDIQWNFEKFLVAPDGKPVAPVPPDDRPGGRRGRRGDRGRA